jgi:hypothetical protein
MLHSDLEKLRKPEIPEKTEKHTKWGLVKKMMTVHGVQVAHVCNPSYSGGRDQEVGGLRPAWANSLQDPISKNPSQKRADKHGVLNSNSTTK